MKQSFNETCANIIVNVIKPFYDKYGVVPSASWTRGITEMKLSGEINNHGVKEMIKHWYEERLKGVYL